MRKYDKKTVYAVNEIIKTKIKGLTSDYEKLVSVDHLIDKELTENKKHDLLNSVCELQMVLSDSLDLLFNDKDT